eukprot:TRINITY_DN996_c0_g1_i9.p1 TRINITY_DN996_c0_g1~~TRINITY_DN996_c0_g1_i9.p1  ORF type:complete len:211 (-),score=82.66 TRINITY_DN996_c0_g1_i9:214-846(-)
MNFLLLSLTISMVSMVNGLSLKGPKVPQVDKEALLQELEEAELLKELETLVQNLDDEQLELLESIMGKDIDEATEFDMIVAELKAMGMDEEDINDLKQLSELMYEFLIQVPEVATKLELSHDYDLLDNVQLYLLGLPNKLGPLGYIALHHVLEDDGEDGKVVDVIVEPVAATKEKEVAPEESAPTFRRKRSTPLEQVMRFRRNPQGSGNP